MFNRLRSLVAAFAVMIVVAGCSSTNEPISATDPSSVNPKASGSVAALPDCGTLCIEDGSGQYFAATDQKIVTWAAPQSPKTVDIEYYNTQTHFVIKVRSTKAISDLVIDGSSTGIGAAANTWATYSYPLTSGWEACDAISHLVQVAGSGPQAVFSITYDLIGICSGCETSFTGEALSCDDTREAVYTFTADEDQSYIKIQGGLTNFTGSNAVVTLSGDGAAGLEADQWTPGQSSNRIIRVQGSILACKTVTITITWNSSNPGSDEITGEWSVKNAAGETLAPDVAPLSCD